MRVKCVSPRLNHIVWGKDGSGARKPHRVQVGETFEVRAIPPEWNGLVVEAGSTEKVAVTNPAKPADPDLEAAKADYREIFGKLPHHQWSAEKIREKIAEHKAENGGAGDAGDAGGDGGEG